MGKAEVIFAEELAIIKDPTIKKFVLFVFEHLTPEYFWSVPCSTTGKYHPQISIGPGGLVRHVKYAIWWAIEIMRCWPNYEGVDLDEVVAALLLHDLKKNGEKLDKKGFPTMKNATTTHGGYLGDQIEEKLKSGEYIVEELLSGDEISDREELLKDIRIRRIISAIKGHMGIWTDVKYAEYKPENQIGDYKVISEIVHLADYCASRKANEAMNEIKYLPEDFEPRYAIGQEDGECGIGFWYGPIPNLQEVLKESGRDRKSIVVELDPAYGDQIIFRWDPINNTWLKTFDDGSIMNDEEDIAF